MYSYGFNSYGYSNPGCYTSCCGYPYQPYPPYPGPTQGFGSNSAIILVLFILLVIIIGARFLD